MDQGTLTDDVASPRARSWGLVAVFAFFYFAQGLCEPGDGLSAQPLVRLLESWEYSPTQIAAFTAMLFLPWTLKPLFGLLTDLVPVAGYRRKSYLIAATLLGAGGLFLAHSLPLARTPKEILLAILLVPTAGVAFADVVLDALLVEKGQERGITGRLQATQWGAIYGATILAGYWGGHLAEPGSVQLSFLWTASITTVSLVMAVLLVENRRPAPAKGAFRQALVEAWRAMRDRTFLGIAAFLFLWNFNPFSSTVMQLHMTGELAFGPKFYGHLMSMTAVGSLAACATYGLMLRRAAGRWLLQTAIVLGITSTLMYALVTGPGSAKVVSLTAGFISMTAMLILFDLAAQACPIGLAGTMFAGLMAVANVSSGLSMALGGHWYERATELWGARTAFTAMTLIGAAFTSGCWLLVPFLSRRLESNLSDNGVLGCPMTRDQ